MLIWGLCKCGELSYLYFKYGVDYIMSDLCSGCNTGVLRILKKQTQ